MRQLANNNIVERICIMRTMKDLAQEALDVQNASNVSGIIHSFSRAITELRSLLQEELGNDFSTTKLNTHPIVVLYSDKIASLTTSGVGCDMAFYNAYKFATDLVETKF
jgi:hypothetical protein